VGLLLALLIPMGLPAQAQSLPLVSVESHYTVDRYGYAIIRETVIYNNSGTSAVQVPSIQLGFGNITGVVQDYNVTGTGYTVTTGTNGNQSVFSVSGGGQSIPAGSVSSFSFEALVPDAVTRTNSTALRVLIISEPFVSLQLLRLDLVLTLPYATQLVQNPRCVCLPGNSYKLPSTVANFNYTYSRDVLFTVTNSSLAKSINQAILVKPSSIQDLHPLVVYSASRTITVSSSGDPVVQDSLKFENLGTTDLSNLTVSPLALANSQITVVPSAQPPLLNPSVVSLNYFAISLNDTSVGLPVEPNQNFTITYYYPLAKAYYSISGGTVKIDIPQSPPIQAPVESYTIKMSLPPGVRTVQAAPQPMVKVNPFESGTTQLSYGLSVGWALDGGVPVASLIFIVSLVGLVAAGETSKEEEGPEETTVDMASAMIKAFEEKTSLINGLFEEIVATDPNKLNKAYFDELRSRLDVFRGRALQRLNELKQKSTTKKFFDLLNQMHSTEREVDRAARDMLNLYEQYYMRRTRKDVYDRLLPNYRRRLDRALNQLSDELNTAQREAKLL